ncbi:hypothetical protein V3C99_001617 [Haemonchus contortus]
MDRNGMKDPVVEAALSRKRYLRKKILEAGLSDLGRPIQQTLSDTVNVIPRCAKETLGEVRGGLSGEKEAGMRQKKAASPTSAGRRRELQKT